VAGVSDLPGCHLRGLSVREPAAAAKKALTFLSSRDLDMLMSTSAVPVLARPHQKRSDGSWLIVSEMCNDANQETT
jgi:hypothetical protein